MEPEPERPVPDYQEVYLESLQLAQHRSVGVEHLALHALTQVGLVQKLADLELTANAERPGRIDRRRFFWPIAHAAVPRFARRRNGQRAR
ncbi:hypothetical protein JZU56_04800 [bacterium]|nr:hypothetical protein [bacterium]